MDTAKNEVISVIDNSTVLENTIHFKKDPEEMKTCPEDKKDETLIAIKACPENPQPSCSNNNSIVIMGSSKDEIISIMDNSTVYEKTIPHQNKPETATCDAESKQDKQMSSDENDDDVQFIPQKVEIINICDDSGIPSLESEDSSSSEEEDEGEEEQEEDDEEPEQCDLTETKKSETTKRSRQSKSVICLDDSESVVEISDEDDDDCWEKKNLPNFLSLDVNKVGF